MWPTGGRREGGGWPSKAIDILQGLRVIHPLTPSLDKSSLSACCVPDSILGAGDTTLTKTKSLRLCSRSEDRKQRCQQYIFISIQILISHEANNNGDAS